MLAYVCIVLYLLILKPGFFVVTAVSAVNSAKSADNRFMEIGPFSSLSVPYSMH